MDNNTENQNQNRFGGVVSAANNTYNKLFANTSRLTPNQQLLKEIDKAKNDWLQAESIFNEALDNTLIDHAIYDMMAAKTRYSFLLKKAREQGVSGNDFTMQ